VDHIPNKISENEGSKGTQRQLDGETQKIKGSQERQHEEVKFRKLLKQKLKVSKIPQLVFEDLNG
jgi:hypothetical protein